jgi:hypothetical protein
MKSHKLNSTEALKFMFAGNSTATFVNTKTDNRFTFKLKQKKDSNLFFVSVLTSSDVYTYIGTVINGQFKHGRKSKINKDAQSVRVFEYVFKNLLSASLPDFIEVWHEGRCGKCGRTLTVPSSISTGLGPECIKSISKSEKRDNFLELILS